MFKAIFIVMCSVLVVLPLWSNSGFVAETDNARKVLSALFEAAGQLNFKQPNLKLTDENKRVAAFSPSRNQIILDKKAYDLCRSFGKDSLNALAFILAHELAHSFQVEIRDKKHSTNFLSYDKIYHSPTRLEKVADIQGAFIAYLAGFKVRKIVPQLLPKIYDAYGLTGKVLKGYPTLEERRATADEVLEINDLLMDLYESGNYLLVANQYDLAIANYEYVLQYYQGREIYNNLGVLHLLSAMEYFDAATDRFVLPIELDATTQLKKIEKSRGEYQLTAQEKIFRTSALQQALAYFKKAIQLDKKYFSAKLNYACALLLLQQPQEAIAWINENNLLRAAKSSASQREKVQLALGVAHAVSRDAIHARTYFQKTAVSKEVFIARQATFNLDVLDGKKTTFATDDFYEIPEAAKAVFKTISLKRMGDVQPVTLNAEGLQMKRLREHSGTTCVFSNTEGNLVSLLRFRNEMAIDFRLFDPATNLDRAFFYNLVAANNGYYLKSEKDGIVLKVGTDGAVLEMVKVIVH